EKSLCRPTGRPPGSRSRQKWSNYTGSAGARQREHGDPVWKTDAPSRVGKLDTPPDQRDGYSTQSCPRSLGNAHWSPNGSRPPSTATGSRHRSLGETVG